MPLLVGQTTELKRNSEVFNVCVIDQCILDLVFFFFLNTPSANHVDVIVVHTC